jgi:predicted HTH transcriptional regulator
VSEGREIEFKSAVGSADKDKREFLADVSSFANAVGGDLLIGVAAKGGVATELVGILRAEADATILRRNH